MFVDSLEGQNLGKYRVLEPLGRGGMARVYRAYHPQLDRYVAIKVLRSDLVEEEEFLARFRREAQAVASLRHSNIVQVFDFDVRGNSYYMVMELLEGDTLRTRLNDYRARDEKMPLGEVLRILVDVLAGLGYAHSEGMIHRDVKPANILLTKRGQAVLTDFGIAQIVGGTRYTVSGALMGTLAYMAPEQGLEGHCDVRSDIYSLGIVLYEMLTGEPPFDAETPLAILMKHVNDPLQPPRKIDPTIPKSLERVVLKALAKRPGDRYQSAEDMAQALSQAAEKARIVLPARVSLPFTFTTADAPSESVAVLSGTAREQIRDTDFAVKDTDYQLSQRLAEEAAFQQEALSPLPRPTPRRPQSAAAPVDAKTQAATIMTGVGILVVTNLLVVFFSLVFNLWGTFGRGWAFELLLIGLLLLYITEATESPGMLIPTGIVLGNGFLFSFYGVTNAWNLWAFLWPLEPLLIIGAIWFTIRLAGQGAEGQRITLQIARALKRPTIALTVIVVILGAILGS